MSATTAWQCCSCRRTPPVSRPRAATSRRAAPPRACRCYSGAACPSTRTTWAIPPAPACPPSTRPSLGVPTTLRPATSSSASSTSAVARSRSAPTPTPRWPGASSTCARCPVAPSSTRACSSPPRCAASSWIWATRRSRAPWPWCTRATPPTPRPAGSAHTPIA